MQLQTFTKQILPYKNQLYRLAVRVVGSPDEARDVVQEVMIKVWDKRHELEQVDNWGAYLKRMTKNLAIDKTRSKHRHTATLDLTLGFVAEAPTPQESMETSDTFAQVRKLMVALPTNQRLVMELRDFDGMTYQEIVTATGLSMSQVKVYLSRARRTVREGMAKVS